MSFPSPDAPPRLNWQNPREVCRHYALGAVKGLGQNFLKDPRLARKIAGLLPLSEESRTLEIGPGLGALTEAILERQTRLTAIEIDARLELPLRTRFGGRENLSLLINDARRLSWTPFLDGELPGFFFANLPYNLSSEFFIKALLDLPMAEGMVMLLQAEAAERLLASPGSKSYGPAAVLAGCYGQSELLSPRISPQAFCPQPTVQSRLIRLKKERRNENLSTEELREFFSFLKLCFANRRKTLFNNLRPENPQAEEALSDFNERHQRRADLRAEALAPEELLSLWRAVRLPFA